MQRAIVVSRRNRIPAHVLACDVGNSRIKFGLFDAPACRTPTNSLPPCRQSAAFSLSTPIDWSTLRRWLNESQETGGCRSVVAGANPSAVERLARQWHTEFHALPDEVLTDPRGCPVAVAVRQPQRVGIDRLLNAVAANVIRPETSGAIIIDSGTATTVDVVDAAGVFRGGAILPGFELAARSLHEYTALLPLLTIEQLAEGCPSPLGTDTTQAIRSGLFWGQLGAVRELVTRLNNAADRNDPTAASEMSRSPLLLLTGGGASLLASHLPEARWEPHLSLQGLVLASLLPGGSPDGD